MTVAYIQLQGDLVGGTEEVNNVDHVEFIPTHVVVHMTNGKIVAFLASVVLTVVTNEE